MADDDWQLKAVNEQFEVFEKLFEPCSSYAVTDLREIIHKVDSVIRKQLRMKSGKTEKHLRRISTELINAIPVDENNLFISYVVVVTNEVNNDKFCKFPVFRVLVGDHHKFVDISGSVYKTWDSFLKGNDMPDCKFCYPVNGCYDVGGKLKVDFALSPAASTSQRRYWYFLGGILCTAVIVAATLFFEVPPFVFTLSRLFISFAEAWASQTITMAMKYVVELVESGQLYRKGEMCLSDLTLKAFNVLRNVHATFKDNNYSIWEEIKKTMSAAYEYLLNKFEKYFKQASNESKYNFFANVVRVEEEMNQAEEEACAQLNEMNRSLTSTESPISSTLGTVVANYLSYNQDIFQSCLSDSALEREIKNRNNERDKCTQPQTFKPTTESLLVLCQTVSKQLGVTTLSDVKDIFESLSCIVKDEYKNKIDNYIRGVYAAKARHGMNLNVYNKSLGIVGDPKDHFMKEAMQSTQESRLAYRLKEKIKEFRMDSKIFLIPIYKMSEDDDVGIYKSIGVRGKGKFSAQWLVTVLKESLRDLDESTLVVNETNSVIYIRSHEISIFAYQEIDEENTSKGIIYVNKLF